MELDGYLAAVHDHLASTAALGDERTREIATALAASAGPAVRLAVLGALSAAADEITAALLDHPGAPAVSVRVVGGDAEISVRDTQAEPEVHVDDKDASARVSLRLSEALKAQIDAAATAEGVSVNTWLVRAASAALSPGTRTAGRRPARNATRLSGWIDG